MYLCYFRNLLLASGSSPSTFECNAFLFSASAVLAVGRKLAQCASEREQIRFALMPGSIQQLSSAILSSKMCAQHLPAFRSAFLMAAAQEVHSRCDPARAAKAGRCLGGSGNRAISGASESVAGAPAVRQALWLFRSVWTSQIQNPGAGNSTR